MNEAASAAEVAEAAREATVTELAAEREEKLQLQEALEMTNAALLQLQEAQRAKLAAEHVASAEAAQKMNEEEEKTGTIELGVKKEKK